MGLNLQHASVVVNMDQPWNPAVLEQRIGRVHRLGQQRPVRVINFVAQGTIEEGMLGLLDFKKSLFAGVLDRGDDEVFLGGTKLKRFIESVEKATTAIPPAMPTEPAGRRRRGRRRELTDETAAEMAEETAAARPRETVAPQERLWRDVAAAGQSLLEKVTQALGGGQAGKGPPSAAGMTDGLLARDDRTGQTYLKLPLPEPETIEKIFTLLRAFTGGK